MASAGNQLSIIPTGATAEQTLSTWLGPSGFTTLYENWMATLPTTAPTTDGIAWNCGGVVCYVRNPPTGSPAISMLTGGWL